MGKFFAILATFFGKIFKEIIPEIMAEIRRPTETRPVGGDQELRDEIDKELEKFWDEEDDRIE